MLRNLNVASGGRRILGTPNVGILAATIIAETASGDNGPGLLYDEALSHAGKQLRVDVTGYTGTPGKLFVFENGSILLEGEADGAYLIAYNVLADNVIVGSDIAAIAVGNVNASAPGATITGSSTITPGAAATGQQNATAPGATLQGAGTIQPGTATGQQNAGAPGSILTGTSTIQSGQANGDHDAVAPGALLTGSATLQAGRADNGSGGASAYLLTPSCQKLTKIITRRAMSEFYLPGDVVRVAARIVDLAGALADPERVVLKTRLGAGFVTTYVFGVDPEVVRDGIGLYRADLALPSAGVFAYRWESAAGGAEGIINVQKSRFI